MITSNRVVAGRLFAWAAAARRRDKTTAHAMPDPPPGVVCRPVAYVLTQAIQIFRKTESRHFVDRSDKQVYNQINARTVYG